MAVFRCLQSGQTVEFMLQHDIDSMRGHGGYVLVDEDGEPVPVQEADRELPLSPAKRMGRPRKAVATTI